MKSKSKLFLYSFLLVLMYVGMICYLDSSKKTHELMDDINSVVENGSETKKFEDKLIAASNPCDGLFKAGTSGEIIGMQIVSRTASDQFYIADKNGNYNTAIKLTKTSSYTPIAGVIFGDTGRAYISVRNGTYNVYGFDYDTAKTCGAVIEMKNSCENQVKLNQTGTFKVERCYVKNSLGQVFADPDPKVSNQTYRSCKNGKINESKDVTYDFSDCDNKKMQNGLTQRYCKVIETVKCNDGGGSNPDPDPKPDSDPARLSGISVDNGTLSPSFKSNTLKYTVNVASDVSKITITSTLASGSKFASGSAKVKTYNLSYGANTIKIKVLNSKNKTTVYTITVNRKDNRSSVNTLSNLKVSVGNLSPAFKSDVTDYTVDVENSVQSISFEATLTDAKSSFVSGFAPGTSNLAVGQNKFYIKVQSEKGTTKVYTITVNRAGNPQEPEPDVCLVGTEEMALLKGIALSVDINGIEIDQLENFDSKTFSYTGLKVPYKVSNLKVTPYVLNDGDSTEVFGNTELIVGEEREIKITVTSAKCPKVTNDYFIYVQRQEELRLGDNANLKSITIKDHDEFKFDINEEKYSLILNKDEEELDISLKTELESTQCDILGNENLGVSSVITIKCVSEDGEDTSIYTIEITGVQKGTNIVLIVILVIIIVIILIYLVLRLLGYRIYFNFAMIGAFFRGIGDKFKSMFDK